MRVTVLALLILVFCSSVPEAASRALVVGNETYDGSSLGKLLGVQATSRQFASALQSLGFDVAHGGAFNDLSLAEYRNAIQAFVSSVSKDDTVVVYYAGHGREFEGINYLLPIGADPSDATTGVGLDAEIVTPLIAKQPTAVIMFIDACRVPGATIDSGLSQPQVPPSNTFMVFSAGPGQSAISTSGFRESLVNHIVEPGVDVGTIVGEVIGDVLSETHNTQRPQPYGALSPSVTLRPPAEVLMVASNVDDNLFVHVDDKLFCQWQDTSADESSASNTCSSNNSLLLRKGPHPVRISIYNQGTYTGGIEGLGGHFPEGWHYHLVVSWKGQQLVDVCDGEIRPKAHGPRHGKTFDTARFTLVVDPHTAEVKVADLVPRVWEGAGGPHLPCK